MVHVYRITLTMPLDQASVITGQKLLDATMVDLADDALRQGMVRGGNAIRLAKNLVRPTEADEIIHISPSPAIDCLIIISCNEHLLGAAFDLVHHLPLQG